MKFPSEYHQEKWKDYEKILMYRANLSMISRFCLDFSFLLLGKLQSVQTEKFIESNSPDLNTTLVSDMFPYAKWALIMTIFGRVILMLISLKKLKVTKTYFYFNLMVELIKFCLP